MNWMPAPQAPMGCPPGLEYLTAIDQVLVQQQLELLEGILLTYSLHSLLLSYTHVFIKNDIVDELELTFKSLLKQRSIGVTRKMNFLDIFLLKTKVQTTGKISARKVYSFS